MTLGGKQVSLFVEGQYRIEKVNQSLEGLKETWATGSVLKGNASGKFFGDHLAPRKQVDGLGCLYRVKGIGEDGIGYRYFTGPKREDATKGKFFSGVPLTRRAELLAGESKKYKPVQNFSDLSGSFGNCRHEGGVDFPSGKKPVAFIDQLLSIATSHSEHEIVLDFFAGSGSTGHAVLEKNRSDSGNRRFILVQLPEPIDGEPSKHISDITAKRLRNVCSTGTQGELGFVGKSEGFRAFKLAPSNFKVWNAHTDEGVQGVERQMELAVNHIVPDRTDEDLFYEILMKSEYPLTARAESFDAAGISAYSVEDDALIVCVQRKVTAEAVAAIAKRSPSKVIFLDEAFSGNDQLKANAKMNFESAGVKRFETV
jgi:adenine-specific DNA-methyltransferase